VTNQQRSRSARDSRPKRVRRRRPVMPLSSSALILGPFAEPRRTMPKDLGRETQQFRNQVRAFLPLSVQLNALRISFSYESKKRLPSI